MSQNERILDLELQLHLLQREVAALREHTTRQVSAKNKSRRWIVCGVGLVMGLGAISQFMATPSEAQAPASKGHKAHTVKAPFHVVDKAGKTILSVEESFHQQRGIFVHNAEGKDMVWVVSSSTGNGAVYTKNKDGDKNVTLGGLIGGLALEGGELTVQSNKQPVLSLGVSPSGSGAGYLAIGNSSGTAVLEAGMLKDGRGIVRVYPFDPRVGDVLTGTNYIVGAKQ